MLLFFFIENYNRVINFFKLFISIFILIRHFKQVLPESYNPHHYQLHQLPQHNQG